jgi:hypothetical protein
MKIIKIASLAFLALCLGSCLKTANDFAGLRTDSGQVVTALLEKQYLVNDGHSLANGYAIYAGFNFAAPANEAVKFVTLHVSQPKAKMSGDMTVKFSMTASASGPLPPAGAVTIADVVVPANSADGFDFPVKFTVNKALLNPATKYAATFTITSVSQGVTSGLENSVEMVFNNSTYTARYQSTLTVVDPANQYGVTNNKKPLVLQETAVGSNILGLYDPLSGSTGGPQVATIATGAPVNIFAAPRYVLDASGKLTSITSGGVSIGATIDPSSGFTYTSNNQRKFVAKYTFPLTTTISGTSTTRTISVTENFDYDITQGF